MTGFVAFPCTAEAEHLIDALNGISNGAMVGKVLKVEWAACSRTKCTKRPCESDNPVAKKVRNRAWSSASGTEAPVLSPVSDPLAGRAPDAVEDNDEGGLILSHDTVEIDNLPLDATNEYLRGMLTMASHELTSHCVMLEDWETKTGYATFSTPQETERIIEQLDGFSNGAKSGMLLKVGYPWPRDEPSPVSAPANPSPAVGLNPASLAVALRNFPLPPSPLQ
jgi:hypothetical protein